MIDIFKVYDNVDKISGNNFLDVIGTIIIEADDFIIFLQQEQLKRGVGEDDVQIGFYTPFTQDISENYQEYGVEKPIQPKIAGEPYNFEWTGKYFKGMFIKVFGNSNFEIEIDSAVDYAGELESRYKKLLGLVDKNQEQLNRFVEGKIIDIINKTFGNV